jgi:hypothetical protein
MEVEKKIRLNKCRIAPDHNKLIRVQNASAQHRSAEE